ncbi:hypothetical protein ABB37_01669 [Leptomonas pyrrhocoris]|uniref:Uncharacterized protein n=1 Tax=Leptomonas pyrrhocoris TaxID=157538 RepID=A0A0M9G976_LEPPY|nr:hypothetical protein ABB37_01669 [Leptomonas pyrrhocoris]KPA85343.1 hypothetical protein ABB37_01669 [Leptomonas pyrrhocoris]|eukprot:XP_015663782.1 hypothetical protein ABB37_01669 [Leptomonas pyrrhocoris]
MFIHRNNVDQYVHGKPRLRKSQPVSSSGVSNSFVHQNDDDLFFASRRRVALRTAHNSYGSHRLAPIRYSSHASSSDSDEITVEEIFPPCPSRGVVSTSEEPCSASAPQPPPAVFASVFYSKVETNSVRAPTGASLASGEERGRTKSESDTSTHFTASRNLFQHDGLASVGGVSFLVAASPDESRLSDLYGQRGVRKHDLGLEGEGGDGEVKYDQHSEKRDGERGVYRDLPATSATATIPATGEPPPPSHPLAPWPQRQPSSLHNGASVDPSSAPFEATTATLETTGAPDLVSIGGAEQQASHVRSVSVIGRTLTAATKALTAAAAREAQRRAEETSRAQAATSPSVEVHLVQDLLLGTALKEKVLLFEAYFAGLQQTWEVMEMCGALYRRDAERARREADAAVQEQERDTQQKLFFYRQHTAAEALRFAADKKHEEQMRAADARIAVLAATVQNLTDKLASQEAEFHEQQKAHNSEVQERLREGQQDAHESALELRALQRAHGEATERWIALQVVCHELQNRFETLRRRRRGRQTPHSCFHNSVEAPSQTQARPRVLPKPVLLASKSEGFMDTETQGPFESQPRNTPLSNSLDNAEDAAAGPKGTSEKPTALEVLLARTQADSGAISTSPLRPHADLVGTATGRPARTFSDGPLMPVAPPKRGGFSSPPDTPLLAAAPLPTTSSAASHLEESVPKQAVRSPDAKPAAARPTLRGSSSGSASQAHGAPDSARSTSSFRPSRLNSVASTRRGSSSALAHSTATSAQGSNRCKDPRDDANHNGAAGVDVIADPIESEEEDDMEWQQRVQEVAAAAVQRELSRLLVFNLAGHGRHDPAVANGTLHVRKSSSPKRNGSVALAATRVESCLSTPRAESGGADGEEALTPAVTLSALQWMRVCETAHLSAHVNSVLVDLLQKLGDSLAQRLQLLEEKDWNKTMARQFIAVDHAAALRRLTAKVDSVVHGSFSAPSDGMSSSKKSQPRREMRFGLM